MADRGTGIPPEDLNRIFDKFYRVQRPEKVSGTGLGLSISKGIVEAHGGFIWAENREGGGTVITISLPWRSPMAESDLRVLVVDDERSIRRFLKASLGSQFVILEAANGEEALNAAASEHPDI